MLSDLELDIKEVYLADTDEVAVVVTYKGQKVVSEGRLSLFDYATGRKIHSFLLWDKRQELIDEALSQWNGFSENFYDRLENGGMEVE